MYCERNIKKTCLYSWPLYVKETIYYCNTKDDIYRHWLYVCTLKIVIINNKFNEHETECINLLIMKLI